MAAWALVWRSTWPLKPGSRRAFGGDGQHDVVGAAGRQTAAAAVEQQCRAGVSAGPAGAFIADPQGEVLAQPGVHGISR